MTTIAEAEEAITQRFKDVWDTTGFTFTLANETDFDKPEAEPWARFTTTINGATQETLGKKTNRKFQRTGISFAQIFVPLGEGTSRLNTLLEQVVDQFEGERIVGTTVRLLDVVPRKTVTRKEDRWAEGLVEIIFQVDEIK